MKKTTVKTGTTATATATATAPKAKNPATKERMKVTAREAAKAKVEADKAKEIAREAAKAKAADKARVKEEAKAKRETEAAERKAAKEAAALAKANKEPDWVTQLDEHGIPEQVDRNVFQFEVKCACPDCTEVRWVTLSGLREVTMCKPHARKTRRNRRVERVKDRSRNHKAIVEEAMELGLFPVEFMAKYGLA